jgi:multidrug resistance protein MdtO
MAAAAQTIPESTRLLSWFGQFLKDELAPYPGRTALVVRMVITSTTIMIIFMAFHLSFAYQAAIFALLISRESVEATIRASATMLVFTALGAAYILTSAWFVISFPMAHLLWVMTSFFLAFFALSAMTDYSAAVIFAVMIAIGVPLWDRYVSAETNVEDTLRLALSAFAAVLVTGGIELLFAHRQTGDHGDDALSAVAERLSAVENLLARYAENRPLDPAIEKNVRRLAMLGTSLLRRILQRSSFAPRYKEQVGTIVALTGRLVDIAANVTLLEITPTDEDRTRLDHLSKNIAGIRADLLAGRIPHLRVPAPETNPWHGVALLPEMESTVSLIVDVFVDSRPLSIYVPAASSGDPPYRIFARDALSNSDHLKFALKGCLTAGLCYIIYNAIDWPGISTAVTTCLLTALSTVGSSRQKQVLRFTGAAVGGFIFGMGTQIFILPHIDSIGGFAVVFVLVTTTACWFMTSSPRLSYFGVQLAVAYYLIHLQEFAIQTSLSIARDRSVGVLFGLLMMWIIFDQVWTSPAVVQMQKTFISTLRLLAEFAREPASTDLKVAIERSFSLRDDINKGFDNVRASADGVLLEFGPSRQQDLASRSRIIRLQPQLRALFLMRAHLWRYRAQLPGFTLPAPVLRTQQEFDNQSSAILDGIADRLEGRASAQASTLHRSFEQLNQAIAAFASEHPQEALALAPRFQAFLPLCQRTENGEALLDQAF